MTTRLASAIAKVDDEPSADAEPRARVASPPRTNRTPEHGTMTKTLTRSWSRVVLDELNREPELLSPMDEPNLGPACFTGRYDDRRVHRRQAGVPRPGCRSGELPLSFPW
uniref:Uncharacterized protein n=1 Tax=Leersia perrieri TaxID=77586 RepID=A0A0D9X6A1_9ORYZ